MTTPRTQTGARDEGSDSIGPLVRARRRRLGLTLKELALRTGLSISFLSQVERNQASPSLSSLIGIARVLGVGIDAFVDPPGGARMVSRADERTLFSLVPNGVQYGRVSSDIPDQDLHANTAVIPPGYVSPTITLDGEVIVYVLEGVLWYRVGEDSFELGAGDAIHFKTRMRHAWGNRTEAEVRLLCVSTVPYFMRGTPAR